MNSNQLSECFDINSEFYDKMMKIISTSSKEKEPLHRHHIVPRSYFKKKKIDVDNSEENIAYLTPYEHCMVHYYAWKSAKPLMKKSMAYAWRCMVNAATRGLQNIDSIAIEYQRARCELHNSREEVNRRLQQLKSTFTCRSSTDRILLHCQVCGYEKYVGHSWHKEDAVCKICNFRSNRKFTGKYAKIMIIAWNGHAYYITSERIPENKLKCYTWEKLNTFASRTVNSYKEGSIIKWKLVGATDEHLPFSKVVPHKPCYTKEVCENYVYWYNIDKRLARKFYPYVNMFTLNYCLEQYKLPRLIANGLQPSSRYFIEEFNNGHTIKEWENIIGLKWPIICANYTVEELSFNKMFDFLVQEYKNDPSIIDRIEDELNKWY